MIERQSPLPIESITSKSDKRIIQFPHTVPHFLDKSQPKLEITPISEDLFEDDFLDDILGAAVVSEIKADLVDISEEKNVLGYVSEVSNTASVKRSTILNADPSNQEGVIYSFRSLQEYKKNNVQQFESAKQHMWAQARAAQDADGCGGVNERTTLKSITLGGSSPVGSVGSGFRLGGSSSRHSHAEGEGDHCGDCGVDKENGVCPKCRKVA